MINDPWFRWSAIKMSQLVPSSRQNQDSEMTYFILLHSSTASTSSTSQLSLLSSRPYITDIHWYICCIFSAKRPNLRDIHVNTARATDFAGRSTTSIPSCKWSVRHGGSWCWRRRNLQRLELISSPALPLGANLGIWGQEFSWFFPVSAFFFLGFYMVMIFIILHMWQITTPVQLRSCLNRWKKPVPKYVPHRKKKAV